MCGLESLKQDISCEKVPFVFTLLGVMAVEGSWETWILATRHEYGGVFSG